MGNLFGRYLKGDKTIWRIIMILSVISLVAIYSSTGSLAYRYHGGDTSFYLIKQLAFLTAGLVVVFITHLVSYRVYYPLSSLLLGISFPLLLVTLMFGANINQASRWIEIPGIGVTFQSSDVAKMAIVLYLAKILSRHQNKPMTFKEVLSKLAMPVGLICALILPANFSTAALIAATSALLMFVGRVRIRHLLLLSVIGTAAITLFITFALLFNNVGRVHTWINRVENYIDGKDSGDNYQVEQAKIAIATGGFVGKGPGKSTQRNLLPHPYSDFIFAIIIEEYGLVGAIVIILLYMILMYRAGVIVKQAKRTFPALLAFGLTLLLVFQAFVNMAVAVNLIPVTGQPLPLVSMGGTSLFFSSASLGIILSISRSQNKKDLFNGEQPVEDNY